MSIKKIKPAGVIWVSWPKKASKVPTDVTEDTIRELALPLGLVNVKVCAVDAPFLDIGTPESLRQAESFVRDNRGQLGD